MIFLIRGIQREKSQAEAERQSFRVLGDYLRILQDWKEHCAPQSSEDGNDPRYAEGCHISIGILNSIHI